ncbi:MAG TPA: OST-HTH/LOTUS domain-containing protein, partial [Ornithinicoccus sp.]|nr:OST-HTH/LOTUS domain-containing protein [Ornithinicoccus sp.]
SDFTGLALRLREAGKTVYGLGLQRTPQSLQNACDRFIALELLAADADSDEVDDAVAQNAGPTTTASGESSINLQSLLTKAVNATAGEDGWVNLAYFGSHLRRMNASFDPRTFGHAKLSSLVEAQRYLETVRRDGVLSVRVK